LMPMSQTRADLVARLLRHLHQVQENLGLESLADGPDARFAEAVDSMGLVEFLSLLADDCSVTVEAIEQAAGHRFSTVGELADALDMAGMGCSTSPPTSPPRGEAPAFDQARMPPGETGMFLAATAVGLPAVKQPARELNALLQRPPGWLEEHAGIEGRCLWTDEDVLDVAARTARECLDRGGLSPQEVGVLLVTAEAPPVAAGLAAALHHRIGLSAHAVALEIGGACTGFIAALWTAQRLLPGVGTILIAAVEAPSRWLRVQPGPAGEAAALFGDGAAACALCSHRNGSESLPITDILLGVDGSSGSLIQARNVAGSGIELVMDGTALAGQAVRALARSVRELGGRHGMEPQEFGAVVAHGGNGRLPAILARHLDLPANKVWSETAHTGNLGSASLPVAWSAHSPPNGKAAVWTAVGAGLMWGSALLGTLSVSDTRSPGEVWR
jgi:3-oxoacyl-[acyl-carrier-protein] synthase-3